MHPNYALGTSRIQIPCDWCGRHFSVTPSASLRRHCSRACLWTSRRKPVQRAGNGRILVYAPDHPRANKRGMAYRAILVAEDTLGRPVAPGEEVHHVNGVKTDDRPENLRVLPRAVHRRLHAVANGLGTASGAAAPASGPRPKIQGERHVNARLTAGDVRTIRAAYRAGGVTQAELAARYGVGQTTISKIILRQAWAWLGE